MSAGLASYAPIT